MRLDDNSPALTLGDGPSPKTESRLGTKDASNPGRARKKTMSSVPKATVLEGKGILGSNFSIWPDGEFEGWFGEHVIEKYD
jgi:hypothetical protein